MWRKLRKISLWAGGIIVGLMLLISALLIIFKDTIKDYALEEVNKHLNKRVHIGYIDVGIWETFPSLSLEFEDVLVHSKFGDKQTGDTALFSKKIRLRFNPGDFISGNYTVNQIDIEDAVFNMKIKEDGLVNYDFLKPTEDTSSTSFDFSLERINISNTRYSYINDATGQNYKTRVANVTLDGQFTEQVFTLNATSDFWIDHIKNKSIQLVSNKEASCDISLLIDQNQDIFEIKKADLKINQLPFGIRGKVTQDSIDFFIGSDNLDLAEFVNNFSVQQLDVIGQLNGTGNVAIGVAIKGDTKTTAAPSIEADFKIVDGSLSDPSFSAKAINAKGHYSNGVLTGIEKLTIPSIGFQSLGRKFDGKATLTDFEHPRLTGNAKGSLNLQLIHRIFGSFGLAHLSGNVNVNGRFDMRFNDPVYEPKNITIFDLRTNLEMDNIKTAFIDDQRQFSIPSGELVIRNQKAVFKGVNITIDDSDIAIDGTFNRIADYFMKSNKLVVNAHVDSRNLNLTELSGNSEAAVMRNWLLPRDIQGMLALDLNKVTYGGHTYEEIQTKLKFGERSLAFLELRGKNAGADISGSLSISEYRPMELTISTRLKSPNIYFDKLFKEWNNFEQEAITANNIKGMADVSLDFKGPFDLFTGEVNKEAFEATIAMQIKNGALVNVETFKEITESMKNSSAKLLINKRKIDAFEKELLNLTFDNFENRLTIKNGVLSIPKMEIRSNAIDINVSGTHSFSNQIDYSFDFRFRDLKFQNNSSEFGTVVDDGTGFRIFLRMYGDLFDPNFAWDKEAKKQDRQEKRDEAKEDLKSVLKSGFGINKGDSTISNYDKEPVYEEEVIMEFDEDTLNNPFDPGEKKKKKSRLQQKLDQWKKENEKEQADPGFVIDN